MKCRLIDTSSNRSVRMAGTADEVVTVRIVARWWAAASASSVGRSSIDRPVQEGGHLLAGDGRGRAEPLRGAAARDPGGRKSVDVAFVA